MMRILWTKEAEFGARAFHPRSVRAVDRVITKRMRNAIPFQIAAILQIFIREVEIWDYKFSVRAGSTILHNNCDPVIDRSEVPPP